MTSRSRIRRSTTRSPCSPKRLLHCLYFYSCFTLNIINNLDQTWFEPHYEENRSSGFPTRCDTNQAAQSLNTARDLKFRIWKKGFCTIQVAKTKTLISFAVTAKLICIFVFHICKNPVFSRCGSFCQISILKYPKKPWKLLALPYFHHFLQDLANNIKEYTHICSLYYSYSNGILKVGHFMITDRWFFLFLHKNIRCGYSLDMLRHGHLMSTHNVCIYEKISKNHQLSPNKHVHWDTAQLSLSFYVGFTALYGYFEFATWEKPT